MALIGGPEAESYLTFVASGHENQSIRQMASRSLQHLRGQQDKSP